MKEQRINIAEILKNFPKGTKLYSPLFEGDVSLQRIEENAIIIAKGASEYRFFLNGCYHICSSGECMLFPSKDQRDWSKFDKSIFLSSSSIQKLIVRNPTCKNDQIEIKEIKTTISFIVLSHTFKNFIWIGNGCELCGWNPKNYQWIVIDDGMCCSIDGTWLVSIYQLSENDNPISNKYKYCNLDKIIKQERYSLI